MRDKILRGTVVGALLALPGVAHADETWLLAGSGSAASAINQTHRDQYSAGAVGDLGIYRSLAPAALIGARLSAGVLSEDTATGTQGDFGLGSASAALRLRPMARGSDPRRGTGLWVEGAGGPGVVENRARPVISPGLGYVIDSGEVGIGPVARYIHVFEGGSGTTSEDAQIGTVGIELIFFDKDERDVDRGREFEPGVQPSLPMVPASRIERDGDRDRDGFLDSRDACPTQPETVNGINDHDGCPDTKPEFIGDRLVIDESVFFGYDEATLRPEGQTLLGEVAALYGRTGYDWKTLRVQGHADSRGSEPYNVDLSRRRAEAVKRYLSTQELPDGLIDVEAYGETRPVEPAADTEAEHAKNRRVEFVIERK